MKINILGLISIPQKILDNVDSQLLRSVWRLHAGKHRSSGEAASVFVCDTKSGASNTQLDVARAAVKRLKTLRHPSVLTFLAECDSPTSVLLATELVTPLSEHLGEILDRRPEREYYLAWGIFQVTLNRKVPKQLTSLPHQI